MQSTVSGPVVDSLTVGRGPPTGAHFMPSTPTHKPVGSQSVASTFHLPRLPDTWHPYAPTRPQTCPHQGIHPQTRLRRTPRQMPVLKLRAALSPGAGLSSRICPDSSTFSVSKGPIYATALVADWRVLPVSRLPSSVPHPDTSTENSETNHGQERKARQRHFCHDLTWSQFGAS